MLRRSLLALATLLLMASSPALAAKPGGGGGGGGTTTAPPGVGIDVSYPQCPFTTPPAVPTFTIVGVNSGIANGLNSCLGPEYRWGASALGTTGQPSVSLYLNTGNPGDVLKRYGVTDWPTSSISADPYGSCSGAFTDNSACAWQYGFSTARNDELLAGGAATFLTPQTYWLDAETANTWSRTKTYNQAVLEGMTSELTTSGNKVGLYSTSSQWSTIVGTIAAGSNLYNLPEWLPGATTQSAATANCTTLPTLTAGGHVTLTQYTSGLDFDVSCL